MWLIGGPGPAGAAVSPVLMDIEKSIGRPQAIAMLHPCPPGSSQFPMEAAVRAWTGVTAATVDLRGGALPDLQALEAVVLDGGEAGDWLAVQAVTEAEDRLLEALSLGVHVLASGAATEALGSWVWSEQAGDHVGGFGWLPGAVVVTGPAAAGWGHARDLLARRRQAYGLAIPPGDAIGLGPEGEVRLSGEPAPGVLLGARWKGSSK